MTRAATILPTGVWANSLTATPISLAELASAWPIIWPISMYFLVLSISWFARICSAWILSRETCSGVRPLVLTSSGIADP